MSQISIVIAGPEDASGMAYVQKNTWLATYPNAELGITAADLLSKDFDSPDKISSIKQRLREPGTARTWVAKAGDVVVGFCVAAKNDGPNAIAALYVLPNYQGQHVGHGLVAAALEWLGSEKKILVEAASYNQKAISFYQSFGFEPSSAGVEDYVLPNGKALPQISLIRPPQV
jgi:ribosomal protein S18 acetylase RimI-like enzyme